MARQVAGGRRSWPHVAHLTVGAVRWPLLLLLSLLLSPPHQQQQRRPLALPLLVRVRPVPQASLPPAAAEQQLLHRHLVPLVHPSCQLPLHCLPVPWLPPLVWHPPGRRLQLPTRCLLLLTLLCPSPALRQPSQRARLATPLHQPSCCLRCWVPALGHQQSLHPAQLLTLAGWAPRWPAGLPAARGPLQ